MCLATLHIGGLIALGFDPEGKYLLVVSVNGLGVFDTGTWRKIARESAPKYPENGVIEGIGPLAGMSVPVVEKNYDTDSLVVIDPTGRFELSLEDFGDVRVAAVGT